jgi:hypothetical protein
MLDVTRFLENVYQFAGKGDLQTATDLIYGTIDRLLCEGDQYDVCNEILRRIDITRLGSTALLRSVLVMTAPAKDKLIWFLPFFAKALSETIRVRGEAQAQRLLGPFIQGVPRYPLEG